MTHWHAIYVTGLGTGVIAGAPSQAKATQAEAKELLISELTRRALTAGELLLSAAYAEAVAAIEADNDSLALYVAGSGYAVYPCDMISRHDCLYDAQAVIRLVDQEHVKRLGLCPCPTHSPATPRLRLV